MNAPNLITRSDCSSAYFTHFPYCLNYDEDNKGTFYSRLDDFTQLVILKGLTEFLDDIRAFRESPAYLNDYLSQGYEENLLDLLIIGSFRKEYQNRYCELSALKALVLKQLIRLRSVNGPLKPPIDKLRGKLASLWLRNPKNKEDETVPFSLDRLLVWLDATGDFHHEVKRMEIWSRYLKNLPVNEGNDLFDRIIKFNDWFNKEAISHLGKYTSGAKLFLEQHEEGYKDREDYFFTGRLENSYHLNMVGAAIMNRNLKPQFNKAKQIILMLPSCMVKSHECHAKKQGLISVCCHCTGDCPVSVTTLAMKKEKVNTVIIEHSSDFSKSLKQWSDQTHTGLIGTACVLNLLEGGFEMKKNNIPSQCIFLDHSCCQKHWGIKDNPSQIDEQQLLEIIKN